MKNQDADLRDDDEEYIIFSNGCARRFNTSRPSGSKNLSATKTIVGPPSSDRWERSMTTLNETVKRKLHFPHIDASCWSEGMESDNSALSQRKPNGIKSPVTSKLQSAADKHVRHLQSCHEENRKLVSRPRKLDLDVDAAKISSWDDEILAVEEERPTPKTFSYEFTSAGSHIVKVNPPAQVTASVRAVGEVDNQNEEAFIEEGSFLNYPHEASPELDSPSSLLDMDVSSGDSPVTRDHGFYNRPEQSQDPVPVVDVHSPDLELKMFSGNFNITSNTSLQGDRDPSSMDVSSDEDLPGPCCGSMQAPDMRCQRRPSEGGQKKIVVNRFFITMDDREDFRVPCPVETLRGASSNGVTSCIENEVNLQKVGEVQWDDVDSSRQFGCSLKSEKNHISKSKLGSPAQAENVVQVTTKQYQKENVNDGASNSEAELLHGKAHSRSQAEETVPTTPVKNLEEMNADEVELLTQQLEKNIANEVPLSCDAHKSVASDESLRKEESHKHDKPQLKSKRARKKSVDRRMSLEDSGSLWKNGRRCSQRRHLKPLEWWRGEKLLYGRVHTPLSTVIRVKHSIPEKYPRGIRDPFVIESFVPAKYNELVRMAAI